MKTIDDNLKELDASQMAFKGIKYIALGIAILILFFGSWYTIGAGERGVLLTLGKPSPTSYESGFHAKIPLIQKVVKMNVKTQKYESDATAASSDLQTVNAKMAINYHITPDQVPRIYQELGIDYATTVIQPLEQEIVKASTARFTAEELITKREEVREEMKFNLRDRLQPRGIIVEELSIVNFDFSQSFNTAIEAKVTAEQNALAAKNKLAQVEYEKQQRITQAQGEAEAIKIQAAAIQVQGGDDYVRLQAISRWNGQLPQVTTGAVPFLDINQVAEVK